MVARSRRILKFIQKVKKFHFSQKVTLFDFSGKNSKSRTFRKKSHFSTFRAIFPLFAFLGSTFRKKLQFSTFRAVFSLFDFSGKNSKSRTFRKKLHFSMSIYSPKYRIWDMSCTRQYLSIRSVSAPSAADIGYGNIGYCPASVSIYPPFQPEI